MTEAVVYSIDQLIQEVKNLEDLAKDDIETTEGRIEVAKTYRDYRMSVPLNEALFAQMNTYALSLLVHGVLLHLKNSPTKAELSDLMNRQKGLEDYYKKHSRALDWAEKLQEHRPKTEGDEV
jgi:hypothetical protein